jgi:hypothetical protein
VQRDGEVEPKPTARRQRRFATPPPRAQHGARNSQTNLDIAAMERGVDNRRRAVGIWMKDDIFWPDAEQGRPVMPITGWNAVAPRQLCDPVRDDRMDQIDRTEKFGGEALTWDRVERGGCADFDHASLVHHDDTVGHRQGLCLIMGDVQRGDAEIALERPKLAAQLLAQGCVKIGERLVEKQNARFRHQSACQRDTLLLAAG